jgi:hypothetical protein
MLLARARTWTNVDSALRLLAEERGRSVAFGRCDDSLLDLLYWQPFVRWARAAFGLPADDTPDAVAFPVEPVLALVEEYRRGEAAPRPLLKRARYAHLDGPTGKGVLPWSAEALHNSLSGVPTIAVLTEEGAVEQDLDLSLRVTAELGESLTILSNDHLTRLLHALHGLSRKPS